MRSQYESSLEFLCQHSIEKLLKVGSRSLLLELIATLAEMKRGPERLILFPPVLSAGNGDTTLSTATTRRGTIARWRTETTCRHKHVAMTAWMKRGHGATLSEPAELTGRRRQTVRAFIRSLSRKRQEGRRGERRRWRARLQGRGMSGFTVSLFAFADAGGSPDRDKFRHQRQTWRGGGAWIVRTIIYCLA